MIHICCTTKKNHRKLKEYIIALRQLAFYGKDLFEDKVKNIYYVYDVESKADFRKLEN